MTLTHDIDNDEQVFHFDAFDSALSGGFLDDLSTFLDHTTPPALSAPTQDPPSASHDDYPTSEGITNTEDISPSQVGKGKAASVPLPIRTGNALDQAHDVFDMSPSRSGSSSRAYPHHLRFPSMTSSQHTPLRDVMPNVPSFANDNALRALDSSSFDTSRDMPPGKGKGRELPPTLPPLIFSPTEFDYGQVCWPSPSQLSSTPGPSSYGSSYGSPNNPVLVHTPTIQQAEIPQEAMNSRAPTIRRIPSRRRSLSSLSTHSNRSLTACSVSRLTAKVPNTLTRKLLFRKRHDTADTVLDTQRNSQICDPGHSTAESANVGYRSRLMPWRGDIKSRSRPSSDIVSHLNFDLVTSSDLITMSRNQDMLTVPGRYYSSPLPRSFLDIVTPECPDIFTPVPIVFLNHFAQLPRELQLHIFSSLLSLHELEHDRCKAQGQWTVLKASSSKNKWIGRNRGIRELVRLSRVSKSWQTLVFDGQLWLYLDLCAFPRMPASLIVRLTESAGAFIQAVNFRGHTRLQTNTLSDLVGNLCLKPAPLGNLPCTQLTAVNLQGCSALTIQSLHHLLIRSPLLEKLSLKGLTVVSNTTCDVLAAYCPRLVSLDLSRCSGMDGNGLLSLASAAISRGECLSLRELRLSGLMHVNDKIMSTLGRAAPYLEVLDLSYARQLHNSSLEAFVSCETGVDLTDSILLTSRQTGRDTGESRKYRRRITRIRHLVLSSCVLLTDIACSNLAYSVPNLEFLELAGIGAELKDNGLVRLLSTTPLIRKLDLEDATDITDSVLTAITPPPGAPIPLNSQPGHALEHLTISYASNLSDDALLALIRGCGRLRVLEADNTSMSASVMREYVQLARARQVANAKIVAIDCRGVTEAVVRELAGVTRPRLGLRAHEARKLRFLDGQDGEELKVGQDECDEKRVVLKTFYSWQTVDQVKVARMKKRKASSRRAMSDSNGSVSDPEDMLAGSGRARWWSPGGVRRITGANSPTGLDTNFNDNCRIM